MTYRDSSYGAFGGGGVTLWVKRLLIANTAVFIALFVLRAAQLLGPFAADLLAFAPARFLLRPWTLLTYAFVHLDIWHLLGNLLVLFFFGPPLEQRWGSRGFIRFYAVAAAGAAVFAAVFAFLQPTTWIVGASGATFGLMIAFAMIWPDQPIHVWGIFPIQAKWFVGILGAIQFYLAVDGSAQGIAVLAHLGGLATAYAYLKSPWAPSAWGDVPVSRSRTKKKAGALAAWTARVRGGNEAARRAAADAGSASSAERQLLDDVDRILDKISAQGLGSLTEEERSRLDEVSRRYRTN